MYMYNMKKKVLDMAVVALMMVVMMALAACGNDDSDDVITGRCVVAGHVKSSEGVPVVGAAVTVYPADVVTSPFEGVTDDSGEFIIEVTEATSAMALTVEKEGYEEGRYTYHDIPFRDPIPDESLGSAEITLDDIILISAGAADGMR